MNEELIYTNQEVQEMAEKVADKISNIEDYLQRYVYTSEEWSKGPLAIFNKWSRSSNPKGKYPVDIELLTNKQKALVAEIVGNAMTK